MLINLHNNYVLCMSGPLILSILSLVYATSFPDLSLKIDAIGRIVLLCAGSMIALIIPWHFFVIDHEENYNGKYYSY